jgi:hypothetical protein
MKEIIGVGPRNADSAALTNQKGRMPLRNPPQFDTKISWSSNFKHGKLAYVIYRMTIAYYKKAQIRKEKTLNSGFVFGISQPYSASKG